MLLFRSPLPPVLICALLWGSAFPAIKSVYQHWENEGLTRTLPLIFLFAGVRFFLAGTGLLVLGRNLKAELRATPIKLILLKTESPGWGLIIGGSLVISSMWIARRTSPR